MRRAAAVGMLVAATGLGACGGSQSSCPAFVEIVAGDFSRTPERLSWTLEVADIPATLTFDQANVPDFVLEYSWAVDLDSDLDGQTDLRVAITHFRQSGAPELVTDDILSATQEDLWTVADPVFSRSGTIDATLTGKTFRLEVDAAEDPGLGFVTDRRQSTWTTTYRWGSGVGKQCEDRLR